MRRMFGALAVVAALLGAAVSAAAADPPKRVVSMNLCTDQLALLLAAPGQLVSVSYLARDPGASALAREAASVPVNHGLAEEIFLLEPDLILAGVYTTRATVSMLRRLGFRVEEFAPENDFDDIRANIARMGALLGREPGARALAAELDLALAAAAARPASHPRPLAAPVYANAFTTGRGTLMSKVIEAAGYDNLGSRLGFEGTARLPLEVLVLSRPDLLIGGDRRWEAPAMAQEVLAHPALRRIAAETASAEVASRYTVCGAPFTAGAVAILTEARARLP